MAGRAHVRANRWLAGLIIALFFVAVAGAAAIGWWYARESPPLQGPILLVSVDGVPATDLSAYGAERPDTPAIDTLASESVVFERAYTHSPQSLPAHASLLTGRLPIEHGVRDDAGFSLPEDTSTLAELLRNRGFATGAAVSSFLLRGRTGLGQGFSFFDDEMSRGASEGAAATDRSEKMPLYAASGVGHLWLADPELRTVEVFRLLGGKWLLVTTFHGDVTVRAEPFDAIELDLAPLWDEDA